MPDGYLLPRLSFAPLNFAQLTYADYVVMLSIKWPRFLPKMVKIQAASVKLLAY